MVSQSMRRWLLFLVSLSLVLVTESRAELDYTLLGRAGGSYFSVPGETRFGAAMGGDAAIALTENWGAVLSLNGNFIETGVQAVGSLGVVKLADFSSGFIEDRISFSAYFDQFTDSRVDTIEGSLYLTQARFQLGYALGERLELGGLFSIPTNVDDDVNFLFTNFPGSLPTAGRVDTSIGGGLYAAGSIGRLQWSALTGYREEPGTLLFGGGLRRPFGERVALFASGVYEEDRGNWGAVLGTEIVLGPTFAAPRRSRPSYVEPVTAPVVDAASYTKRTSPTRLASLPGEPLETPPANSGVFPQGLGDDEAIFQTQDYELLWTQRYLDWNARQLTVLHAHDVWRGLNADGLTDRNQNRIQSPFSGFNLRTNGAFGRSDGRSTD